MKKKIKIQNTIYWSIVVTLIFTALFIFICIFNQKQFHSFQESSQQYVLCKDSVEQLEEGCDYLVEQARLYAMTGNEYYMNLYFREAHMTKRREHALKQLEEYFDGTQTFTSLKSALKSSGDLMSIDYYSMRLIADANRISEDSLQQEVAAVKLTDEDALLSSEEKLKKASSILCDNTYQALLVQTKANLANCTQSLLDYTQKKQNRAQTIFFDSFRNLKISTFLMVFLMLAFCFTIRHLIVKPLISYNECIRLGEIFPVLGAVELQNLAITYNQVYRENQQTQQLIRHQAEYDALTDCFNRRSFNKFLSLYETDAENHPFALILIDIDVFKSVNDTYGHAIGDVILKKVADYLKAAFRNNDYVCRIGGDEFAILMVEMTTDLQYTIKDKIDSVNQQLSSPEKGIPKVSLSAGVAFSDRENPGENIFEDADKALYKVKGNGRNGCGFY